MFLRSIFESFVSGERALLRQEFSLHLSHFYYIVCLLRSSALLHYFGLKNSVYDVGELLS